MKKFILIFALALVTLAIVGAGCAPAQQQGQGQQETGSQTFGQIYGTGNGKCTATNGSVEVTWWIKSQDYKLQVRESGANKATVVKKGDNIYMLDSTNKCSFYNIKDMESLVNESQGQNPAEGTEATVDAYKGYNLVCVNNVVTDADITPPATNCEDLTAALRQAKQQMCQACQQNPQAFGGDCSQYC